MEGNKLGCIFVYNVKHAVSKVKMNTEKLIPKILDSEKCTVSIIIIIMIIIIMMIFFIFRGLHI